VRRACVDADAIFDFQGVGADAVAGGCAMVLPIWYLCFDAHIDVDLCMKSHVIKSHRRKEMLVPFPGVSCDANASRMHEICSTLLVSEAPVSIDSCPC